MFAVQNHLQLNRPADELADAQAGAAAFGPTWFNANFFPHLASEQRRSAGPVVALSA